MTGRLKKARKRPKIKAEFKPLVDALIRSGGNPYEAAFDMAAKKRATKKRSKQLTTIKRPEGKR